MAMTDQNVTDLIRALINESTAKFWTSDNITLYKTAAMQVILNKFYPWLYEEYKTYEDFTLTSGTSVYSLPTNCYKPAKFEVKTTGDKLRFIREDELYKYRDYGTGYPVAWMYKGGQVEILPEPNFTDTDYLVCWYMPILDAVTEFPDSARSLIAVEAAILAKTKDEDVTPDLLQLRRKYEDALMTYFALTQMGSPDFFSDFCDEDSYA